MNTAVAILLFLVELAIWLAHIALGSYLGGIAIGFAGAHTVMILCYIFMEPAGSIPWDVLQVILAVVCLSATVQAAGGMDYMVKLAERLLRSHPKYITMLAPLVVYTLTIVCGTGYIFFAILPVVAEVAKCQGVRPARPLTTASLAAMFGVIASPLSSAMVLIADNTEAYGRKYSYIQLILILIPATFLSLAATSVVVNYMWTDLWEDPEFIERYRNGLVTGVGNQPEHVKEALLARKEADNDLELLPQEDEEASSAHSMSPLTMPLVAPPVMPLTVPLTSALTSSGSIAEKENTPHPKAGSAFQIPSQLSSLDAGVSPSKSLLLQGDRGAPNELRKGARTAVLIFLIGLVGAMIYAVCYSQLNETRDMPSDIGQGIVIFTLSTAMAIMINCKVPADAVVEAPMFKSGIVAAISVLGIAWAGSTLVDSHLDQVTDVAADWIKSQSWVVALVCTLMASFMMSQAAAARVFIPQAFALGVSSYECLIAYSCCACVFLLPASPAIVASVSLDDTGTTKPGKYVFDHTMMIPGLINLVLTVGLVALFGFACGGTDALEASVPN